MPREAGQWKEHRYSAPIVPDQLRSPCDGYREGVNRYQEEKGHNATRQKRVTRSDQIHASAAVRTPQQEPKDLVHAEVPEQ